MGVLSMSPNSRYGVKGKRLPLNFHERVLELEIMIDRGNFDIDTINDLILLYSVSFLVLRIYQQAVEYYNGHNDEKYTFYTDRMQTLFV